MTGGCIHGWVHYLDITSICGVADDTWQTVSLTGKIPPHATYVLLYIKNANAQYWFDVRPKGSSWMDGHDTPTHIGSRVYHLQQKWMIMKLNSSLQFEVTRSNANISVIVCGWADGAVHFLDDFNRIDITPTANTTWEEKDLSSYIPADATGVIVKMVNSIANGRNSGLREKGSSNGVTWTVHRSDHWYSSGVDANKKVEVYKQTADITIYLVGYYTAPVHFLTDKINREPVINNLWQNVDISGVCPTDNIDFGFFSSSPGSAATGIHSTGGTGGSYGNQRAFGFANVVTATTFAGYTNNDSQHIYVEGYQETDTERHMLDIEARHEAGYSPVEVMTTNGVYGIRWLRKIFIHNDLFWMFYVTTGSKCYYKTSSDGITWSSSVYLHDTSYQFGNSCQIWFDGIKVHIFVKEAPKYYYRSGTPESDGTITWDAVWQVAMSFIPNPSTIGDASGSVDKDGYPWLTWTIENGGGSFPDLEIWVNGSQNNNGTWVDLAGYPKDITNGTLADNYREGYILPFPASRNMYAILFKGGAVAKGRHYTQATDTWGGVETISTSNLMDHYPTGNESWSMSAVIDQYGHIHIVFLDENNRLIYLRKDFNTGYWDDEEVLETGLPDHTSPQITIDYSNDELYIFFVKDDNHVYCQKRVNWYFGTTKDTFDFSNYIIAHDPSIGDDSSITCQRRVIDDLIGVSVVTGSASPYSYKFIVFEVSKLSVTIDGATQTTPWKGLFLNGDSIIAVMPEAYGAFSWKHWIDVNGVTDVNRTKTLTMNPTDYFYEGYYLTKKGWFSEIKEDLKGHLESCITEASVSGNWRENIREFSRNMPFISVRLGPETWDDVYDRRVVELCGNFGTLADYAFSLHIFHSNCTTAGEEKGKYAQDLASRIITCFTQCPAPVGADIYDIRARESEPTRGGHRISRVIITGRITIKRID